MLLNNLSYNLFPVNVNFLIGRHIQLKGQVIIVRDLSKLNQLNLTTICEKVRNNSSEIFRNLSRLPLTIRG